MGRFVVSPQKIGLWSFVPGGLVDLKVRVGVWTFHWNQWSLITQNLVGQPRGLRRRHTPLCWTKGIALPFRPVRR